MGGQFLCVGTMTNNNMLEETAMSKKQLPKSIQFIFKHFERCMMDAAEFEVIKNRREAGNTPVPLIIAGGAVRDTYFDHPTRDLDFYVQEGSYDPSVFAAMLEDEHDFDEAARAAGYRSGEIVRHGNDEDMHPHLAAVMDMIDQGLIPSRFTAITNEQEKRDYAKSLLDMYSLEMLQDAYGKPRGKKASLSANATQSSNSGSASGSKIGSTHPLRGIETFTVYLDNERYEIELMTVKSDPVDYVMNDFAVKLCRCYFDGHGIHYTRDFMQDAQNKTLTVACRVDNARMERLFSYYLPKLQHYFPDFDVRVDLQAMNRR